MISSRYNLIILSSTPILPAQMFLGRRAPNRAVSARNLLRLWRTAVATGTVLLVVMSSEFQNALRFPRVLATIAPTLVNLSPIHLGARIRSPRWGFQLNGSKMGL